MNNTGLACLSVDFPFQKTSILISCVETGSHSFPCSRTILEPAEPPADVCGPLDFKKPLGATGMQLPSEVLKEPE